MIFFLMIIAAIGMIFGAVKMKQGMEWGKGVTVACAILVLILAVAHTKNKMGGGKISDKEIARIQQREKMYQQVSAEKLARKMAAAYPGSKAVIIRPMDLGFDMPDLENKIEGIKTGFGQDIEIIGILSPEVPQMLINEMEAMKKQYLEESGESEVPEDYVMSMGLGMEYGDMIDVAQFNQLAKKIPDDADLVVLLTEFPYELEKISLWSKKPRPKVAGIVNSIPPKLDAAIEAGYITAVVLPKYDGDFTSKDIPDDIDERFDRRFLLVTAENIKDIVAKYPQLFPTM